MLCHNTEVTFKGILTQVRIQNCFEKLSIGFLVRTSDFYPGSVVAQWCTQFPFVTNPVVSEPLCLPLCNAGEIFPNTFIVGYIK